LVEKSGAYEFGMGNNFDAINPIVFNFKTMFNPFQGWCRLLSFPPVPQATLGVIKI